MIGRIRPRPARIGASDHREALEAIVRSSSDKMRQFLFAYLLLVVYVAAVVLSTTDRQLLLVDQGLKLPLIDLIVPLPGFYVVAPYFILSLHFNFLQNLTNHHVKLMAWRRSWSGLVPTSRINPFIFDFASLGGSTSFFPWVKAINSFLCFYSAPLLIVLLMWRFADYQSGAVLCMHLLALWIDVYFVSKARAAFVITTKGGDPSGDTASRFLRVRGVIQFFNAPFSAGPDSYYSVLWGVCLFVVMLKVLVCWDVFVRDWDASFLRRYAAPVLMEIPDDRTQVNDLFGLLPRIAIDKTDVLFRPDVARMKLQSELIGGKRWETEFEGRGMSLDLRGRSLRYLSVPYQVLPRLWAQHAHLQGANFSYAQLSGSVMGSAQLQGARFDLANLDGSYFPNTNLRGASLANARLAGSYIDHAALQGADLRGAQMQAVFMAETELQGAVVEGSNLLGAYVNRLSVWGVLAGGEGATVLTDSDGRVPKILRLQPDASEVRRWAADMPSLEDEKGYTRWMLGGDAEQAGVFSLRADNDLAVKEMFALVCGDDSERLSRIALNRYLEFLLLLDHPAYGQLSEVLQSARCSGKWKQGELALRPVSKR
ncbi:putative low-complexity protein [Polaromonas sp. CF318]|uniref:pentapeptide repeat-containing protein n=1 Tax=Polaromonas sp. CF318 TaxID=1144318 RepID=UPI000270EB2C|nr:pentapeptide repeat-containing protein [Polaromonas sp. CF318]EJL76929.1 putative low-complexity protein [Polaromonas sp. CF318]